MKKNADRYLTAIFCDDIRHEIGNKLSFMGCYQRELIVAAPIPTALAKLCVYAIATTPKGKPFKTLTFRVMKDDVDELARLEVPPPGLTEAAQIVDETATRKSVNTALAFSPFLIEKAMSIRVMADTEEGEITGPRLLIKIVEGMESATPTLASPGPAQEAKRTSRKKASPAGK